MAIQYNNGSPFLGDTSVDNIVNQTGTIDTLAPLDIDIPDIDIIRNLNMRIQDSQAYWDSAKGFDLTARRNKNVRYHLGHQVDTNNLYRYQTPYIENELFVGLESILAYTTAQQAQPEIYPAQDTDRSKIFAQDLEKALMSHSQKFDLMALVEVAVRNLMLKQIGVIKLSYNPDYGKNGEVIPTAPDPAHIIFDKNAVKGENPEFICHVLKMSASEVCGRWPKKKKEIMDALGIKREGYKNMEQEVAISEVWLTYYDKNYKPQEGLVYYFGKVVLEKNKNPNWIYSDANRNFLDTPLKPFILLNFINDGSHVIDNTTPFEQALGMQDVLNKRGRQIMENADRANGTLVISTDSGLTKDDAQNLTGDPNQKLLIKTAGQRTSDMIYQVPPHDLPNYVINDKMDARTTIHAILGTPSDFTGADNDGKGEETLGQSMLKKNQASGRQDAIVRAIDRFMDKYFNYLTHMMAVHYDEKHFFVFNGGDGEFDYITISRDLFEDGIAVYVKAGTTLPFDKGRQEAVSLKLADMGVISPLDLYKDLHMDRIQQRYDNWYKYKTTPEELARDAQENNDQSDAFVAYTDIMNGKDAPEKLDPNLDYILSLRKLMVSDEFLKADKKKQSAFIKFVDKCIDSLDLRNALDEMSKQGPDALKPGAPQQPQMMQQPQMPMQPGMQPPAQPPMMPNGLPPSGAGQPPQMGLLGSFPPQAPIAPYPEQGIPGLQNPSAPQTPSPASVTGLPSS